MPRFIPPHLLGPVVLLIILLWIMLVHHFRRNTTVHKFLAETIGDDTPEQALTAFQRARSRLARHLNQGELNSELRRRIEAALDGPQRGDPLESQTDRE